MSTDPHAAARLVRNRVRNLDFRHAPEPRRHALYIAFQPFRIALFCLQNKHPQPKRGHSGATNSSPMLWRALLALLQGVAVPQDLALQASDGQPAPSSSADALRRYLQTVYPTADLAAVSDSAVR